MMAVFFFFPDARFLCSGILRAVSISFRDDFSRAMHREVGRLSNEKRGKTRS